MLGAIRAYLGVILRLVLGILAHVWSQAGHFGAIQAFLGVIFGLILGILAILGP